MSLYDRLNQIENWKYYDRITYWNYKQAINNPKGFIREYFSYGGKLTFLLNAIFENNEDRAKHVVNAYFLGLYLVNNIGLLQPTSVFLQGKNFLWAWFLCSLYHDAFFEDEEVVDNDICYDYCNYSNGLLYTQTTIEKYYNKNTNVETSFDGKVHYDHGIVAASLLYKNYVSLLDNSLRNNNQTIKKFFAGENINVDENLIINYDTFIAVCRIAKVIACHNIFICDNKRDKTKYKNAGLSHLIEGTGKFHKMPHRNFCSRDDYGKLYYLLALTDTLEPSKRGINIKDIDIKVDNQGMICELTLSNVDNQDYLEGVQRLDSWLDCIEVKDNGNRLELHDLRNIVYRIY